jgi:Septum formation inhibitor-activating ATPase
MGLVTVITSGKGGVGKSTVSAGLGTALAARGRRVLLIDCDAGLGCLDHILGVTEQQVFDLADIVSGRAEPSDAVYACPSVPNLFLLPAPGSQEDVVSPEIMKQLMNAFSKYYDHVLIDSPAGVGSGFISAVSAAQRALVVSTPDPVCLRNTAKTRQILEQYGMKQQRLVLNRFSSRNFRLQGFYPDLDTVIDAAGIRLIAVIPEDPLLAAAAAKSESAPQNCAGSLAFGRLAARQEGEQVPLAPLQKF